jgi:hypothetical protein
MTNFYLERKESQEAKNSFEKAIALYSEWGATKKGRISASAIAGIDSVMGIKR